MSTRRNFFAEMGAGLVALGMASTASAKADRSEAGDRGNTAGGSALPAETVTVKVKAPLFCPYHSVSTPAEKGGGAHYYRSSAFAHNPFTIAACGMSGSPLIVDANGTLVGFMSMIGYEHSVFVFDGKETLTIHVPNGQELFIDESGQGDAAWKKYNAGMMKRLNVTPLQKYPDFWADVEYCTWVEQKHLAVKKGGHFNLLNHDFVESYLNKVIEYGYPKGKMTLDHGWGLFPDGSVNSGFGSWYPDPKKFPNFRKTLDMIQDKGFTPGLWIGFPKIHAASMAAQRYPELLGHGVVGKKSSKSKDIRWLNPHADLFEYASEVISRYVDFGVKKFKIDMSYNTKSNMLHIHQALYRAAKAIDPDLEMEFHVADIFFAKYMDVVRTNDVWVNDQYDWQGRVKAHYTVSYKSCAGRGINLDHIGGNDAAALTEEKFLKHLALYKGKVGYPLVSVLPHHISRKCVDATGEYLWDYQNGPRNIVSNFYE